MTEDTPLTGRERQLAALEANRAGTQFGGEKSNPQSQDAGGNKPWSIRNSMRYIARQEIDQSDPQAFKKLLPPKPTVAQLIAANALAKATKADMRAVEFATDQIDGKLTQTMVQTDLESIRGMTDEELSEITNDPEAARARYEAMLKKT
jgi:hypothetical protein